jgi:hypothetical protein
MRRIESELPGRVLGEPSAQFFTSGEAALASRIMSLLWDKEVVAQQLPKAYL